MTSRAELLTAASGTALVGRHGETERLAGLLDDARTAVIFVHGPGGVGKSLFVRGALARSRRRPVWLDGRTTEPTVPGALAALQLATGAGTTPRDGSEAAAAVTAQDADVVVVDAFERLNLLDDWVRNHLAAALPAGVTLVLVGRRPPNLAWRTSPGWRHQVAELVLGPLDPAGTDELLARSGLDGELAGRIAAFGRGHPLALELAVEAVRRHPQLRLEHHGTAADVVEELFDVLLDDLEPSEREVVEAASVLRRVTRPGLGAVLDEGVGVEEAWQLLRRLPFVAATPLGLELEAVAHTVVSEAVEARDPGRVRTLRARAARALLPEAGRVPDWNTAADLLHLVQNPLIRNAYQPPIGLQHPVESADAADRDAVLDIVERHQGPVSRRLLGRWWEDRPADFRVTRGERHDVTAFSCTAVLPAERLTDPDDPVTRAVAEHLRHDPLAPGRRALLLRSALSRDHGESHGPELATLVVDVKRTYFEMRTVLGRVYTAVRSWQEQGPVLRMMGFRSLPDPATVGDRGFTVAVLDFGPGGVDGWVARHVLAEAAADPGPGVRAASEEPAASSAAATASPLRGLSPRELEVLGLLAQGRTNRELAGELFISERTANRHVSNIFAKLAVRNRTAATRVALDAGLVS